MRRRLVGEESSSDDDDDDDDGSVVDGVDWNDGRDDGGYGGDCCERRLRRRGAHTPSTEFSVAPV